jgi:hypothetical protein
MRTENIALMECEYGCCKKKTGINRVREPAERFMDGLLRERTPNLSFQSGPTLKTCQSSDVDLPQSCREVWLDRRVATSRARGLHSLGEGFTIS